MWCKRIFSVFVGYGIAFGNDCAVKFVDWNSKVVVIYRQNLSLYDFANLVTLHRTFEFQSIRNTAQNYFFSEVFTKPEIERKNAHNITQSVKRRFGVFCKFQTLAHRRLRLCWFVMRLFLFFKFFQILLNQIFHKFIFPEPFWKSTLKLKLSESRLQV